MPSSLTRGLNAMLNVPPTTLKNKADAVFQHCPVLKLFNAQQHASPNLVTFGKMPLFDRAIRRGNSGLHQWPTNIHVVVGGSNEENKC